MHTALSKNNVTIRYSGNEGELLAIKQLEFDVELFLVVVHNELEDQTGIHG